MATVTDPQSTENPDPTQAERGSEEDVPEVLPPTKEGKPGFFKQAASVLFSLLLHGAVLMGMYLFKVAVIDQPERVEIETVFVEEEPPDQRLRELSESTEVSETLTPFQTGGQLTASVGASSAPTVSQQKIDEAVTLDEPVIDIPTGEIAIPTGDNIGVDLGQSQIAGEVAAVVPGYGAALSQLTQELERMMRQTPILVVWLFDESGSMKNDQELIREHFEKVYTELGLLQEKSQELRRSDEILSTVIMSYGEKYRQLNPRPTDDIDRIKQAISDIPIDESGAENMCLAIRDAIRKFGPIAKRGRIKKRLVVVVVTDESGDDGDLVEETLKVAKAVQSPIYFLGRESMFGYPTARIRWTDERGLPHWLPMRRGPETAYREALQWNGLRTRWDADRAGFGPYEQARLARETGGVFYLIPGEEENLVGRTRFDAQKLDYFDLKQYQPLLLSRADYEKTVVGNEFRREVSRVIQVLDPREDELLNIKVDHYSIIPEEFRQQAGQNFQRAARGVAALSQAIDILERIEPLRAKEDSERWRAAYDLIHAQVLAYRVRLFQYMLAVDEHIRDNPELKNPKNNEWDLRRTRKVRTPDEEQFARVKDFYKLKQTREEFIAEMERQKKHATELYNIVIETHPKSPWARRAQAELSQGFGLRFVENFWDPRYREPVKLPKL